MSKKDGIVKLESSPNVITTSSANIVRVQKTAGGQQTTSIIRMAPKPTATTQMRMVPKTVVSAALNNATEGVRLSPGMSRSGITSKIKTPIKPAVRVNSTGQKDRLQAQRMLVGAPKLSIVHRGGVVRPIGQRMPPLMTFLDVPETDVKSESSEDDFDPFPKDLPPPEPDSPPREFTLDPITGLVLGQAEGEPEPQEEPEQPEPQQSEKVPIPIIIKQEQMEDSAGQDMPSLIIPDSSNVATISGETTTTITLPENGEPLMITGEDGVVYQVAGQNEEGQTLLVAQGADGQMYVTAATTSEDAQNNVLTLDSAVAEAMGDTENVRLITKKK